MKTNLLLTMAMAALLTAGCSQNEIMDVSPDAAPAVGFKVFADAQTRGTITKIDNATTGVQTKGFGVMAYYTGQSTWAAAGASTPPNFMYNQKVEYKSSVWTYTPVKYWPNTEGDKISFFAYAPYSTTAKSGVSITSTKTTNGAPTLRFTLQPAPADMVDLVASNATQTGNDKTIDVTKRTSAVNFKFRHVLTRASFKAKLDAGLTATPETHIFITDTRILGTASNGANGNASGANSSSKFYNSATYKWADGTWDYTTVAPTVQPAVYPLNSIMPLTSKSGTVSGYSTPAIELPQAATPTELFKAPAAATTEYLFLIPPRDITGITAPTDVRVQLDYDIVTSDGSLSKGYSITSTSATVSLPNGTLKRGSAYVYTFTVGLEKVQVSASVEDWATDTGIPIPGVDATAATATAVNAALTTLTTTKQNNPNCNYFVVNIAAAAAGGTWSLSGATTNFVSGDRIELNFTGGGTLPTVTLSNWTVTKSSTKIILERN